MVDNETDPNRLLQQQLVRFTSVQQQLIETKNRLDQERSRLTAISRYNARALSMEDEGSFLELTAESVAEVFDLQFGAIVLLEPSPSVPPRLGGWTGIAPEELQATWMAQLLDDLRRRKSRTAILQPDSPLLSGSAIHQLVATTCLGPDGTSKALLLGGTLQSHAMFYESIARDSLEGVALLSQQVGALLQSRQDRALIETQLKTISLSQERLAQALDGGEMGLWDWDLQSDTVHFSSQWSAMLGYADDDLKESFETWVELTHPDDRAASVQRVKDHLEGRTDLYINEHRLRSKSGDWVWVLARGKLRRNKDGSPSGFIGVHIDITERQAAARALKDLSRKEADARKLAEQASRSKSAFLAHMSHEVRTPMNGVMGMLQLLEQTSLDAEQQGMVAAAMGAARGMLTLLGDILDHSKIESGKLTIESAPFSPVDVAYEVRDLLMPTATARQVTLDIEVGPAVPCEVTADPTRFRQVLFNLVGNAVKFTKAGSIRIRLDHRGGTATDAALSTAVVDSGIGMTPEQLDRIFHPFEQADVATTRRFGGTGLGLSISRELAHLMGGDLTATSEHGRGSTFEFSIRAPAVAHSEAPRRRASLGQQKWSPPSLAHRVLHVLVVEDNPLNQVVARSLLEKMGVTTSIAESGARSLELLEQGPFDMIFMDLQMPDMDGLEATRRIRDRERKSNAPRTPIVALTASAMAEDREQCLAAGMDSVLTKPLRWADLEHLLTQWASPDERG